jgi:hypothetical protein
MWSTAQTAINRRTGWANWFINLFLLFLAVIVSMAALLLATRPEGFRTVAIAIGFLMALGLVASLQGAHEDLIELDSGRPTGQLELVKQSPPLYLRLVLRRIRILLPYTACIGLAFGLLLALAGE